MPAVIKATWVFSQRQQGWTESLFFEQSTEDLRAAYSKAFALGQLRAALIGIQTTITAIRVSIEVNNAGQRVVGDSLLNYVNLAPAISTTSEDASTALQVIFRSGDAVRRKLLFMRGIWDSIVDSGGLYNDTVGDWATKFSAWRASLIAGNWGWLYTTPAVIGTIGDYDVSPQGFVTFTLQNPGIFGPGPYPGPVKVRIARLNGRSTLNGTLIVQPTGPNTCITTKPHAAAVFQSPGTMRTYNTSFIAASTVDGQKIVIRKAGSPLLGSRGRQRVSPKA